MNRWVPLLNGYLESCSEVRDEIIALIPDNEIAEEAQKWIDYQTAIDNTLEIAQEYLSKLSSLKVDRQATSRSAECKRSHLKVPKLELPKFDGVVLRFQNFWDLFEATVHDNDNVPDVQKFTYLRSALEGVAYLTIEGFEVTSANYHHTVDALKRRFGGKRIIISSLVKSIVQLKPRSNEGVASLRDLHDTLKNRIRALQALGERPMTHSCILLPIMETKLPPELSEKWELEITDIKEESINATCSLCKEQGHDTPKCPELKRHSVEQRWQSVRENRLCFNCLKPANTFHYSSVCSQPKCSVEGCGRRHHTMLHGDGDRSTEGQIHTTINGFVASCNSKMQQTLLQTATAVLVAGGTQRVPVRVLFDSGSQRSYITKNFAESLALDGPSEVLSVSMLGGESSQTKRMKRVSFSLISIQASLAKPVRMEALTIDKICTPLEPVEISLEKYPHLKNLVLADTYPRGSVNVDI